MRTFTVREHEAIPIDGDPEVSLSGEEVSLLDRLKPLLPAKALTWERQHVRLANFCGLLQVGEVAIEVLPKIYGEEQDRSVAQHVVIRMLEAAGEITTWSVGPAFVSLQAHHLLDVLIASFLDQILGCLRQGPVRTYIDFEEELGTIRGRIDFTRLARQTTKERIPCRFQEYSEDNLHNRVLKDILRQLLGHVRAPNVRSRINEILLRFSDVTPHVATVAEATSLTFDRATQHWKSVFERCVWFLRGLHPDVFSGSEKGICLVFDMNRLFEAFASLAIARTISDRDLRVHFQGPPKALARDASGRKAFRLRPDVVVTDRAGQAVLIADAK